MGCCAGPQSAEIIFCREIWEMNSGRYDRRITVDETIETNVFEAEKIVNLIVGRKLYAGRQQMSYGEKDKNGNWKYLDENARVELYGKYVDEKTQKVTYIIFLVNTHGIED